MPPPGSIDKRMAAELRAPQEDRRAEARRGHLHAASTTACARRSAASPHELADQYELQRIGHPFYNSRAGGGEGHLEVAKNIYYSNKDMATWCCP